MFGVSRPTVRRAIDILEDEGLLVRRQGLGTFVAKLRIEQPMRQVIGFSERMRRNGMTPSNRVLEMGATTVNQAGPTVGRAPRLEPNDPILRLARIRLAHDETVVLETNHLPIARFSDRERQDLAKQAVDGPLLEHYGVKISFFRETLEPVLLSAHEAGLLQTMPGTPGMLARIVTFDQARLPVEHSLSLVRGARCQYEITFAPSDVRSESRWHILQTQLEVGSPGFPSGMPTPDPEP